MEVLTAVPGTGTKLMIDADRQFDVPQGDSTLRIQGQTQDGSPVFDATYVEVTAEEARLVGWFIRAVRQPGPELLDQIAQEVSATYSAKLSGRDSHHIAELAWKGIAELAQEMLGPESSPGLRALAERFERASARSKRPISTSGTGNGTEESKRHRS
jgi:hypothetical protein